MIGKRKEWSARSSRYRRRGSFCHVGSVCPSIIEGCILAEIGTEWMDRFGHGQNRYETQPESIMATRERELNSKKERDACGGLECESGQKWDVPAKISH